jgi:hypothetical protein
MYMMNTVLPKSLGIVNYFLRRPEFSLFFSLANDPLEINLPAYGGAGPNAVSRETLEIMASLYFQAELEQAGVIPIAELLTENRFSLQIRDAEAANIFEQFATRMRTEWYKREVREQIFARTFGLGVQATNDAGVTVNRNFETLFAQTCYALNRYQTQVQVNSPPGAYVVPVEIAFKTLIQNLSSRVFGNTLSASNRIQSQLQAGINLLNHRGVTTLFQARNIWELIRNILGAETPDLQRIITRAQSGLRIIGWMAENLNAIQTGGLENALRNQSGIFNWAANWLHASGMENSGAQQTDGGYQNPIYGYGQAKDSTTYLSQEGNWTNGGLKAYQHAITNSLANTV